MCATERRVYSSLLMRRAASGWWRFPPGGPKPITAGLCSSSRPSYPQAEKIILVQDNFNTHNASAFYENLPAAQARTLADKFEFHYTPTNASWLNMAELELSAISRQCLHARIPDVATLTQQVAACIQKRNEAKCTVKWQFTTQMARQKLQRHYQKVCDKNSLD